MNKILLLSILALPAIGYAQSEKENYTLYRGGVYDKSYRGLHAFFNAGGEAEDWNKKNCEEVADALNQRQKAQSHPAKFWCEKGAFKD